MAKSARSTLRILTWLTVCLPSPTDKKGIQGKDTFRVDGGRQRRQETPRMTLRLTWNGNFVTHRRRRRSRRRTLVYIECVCNQYENESLPARLDDDNGEVRLWLMMFKLTRHEARDKKGCRKSRTKGRTSFLLPASFIFSSALNINFLAANFRTITITFCGIYRHWIEDDDHEEKGL